MHSWSLLDNLIGEIFLVYVLKSPQFPRVGSFGMAQLGPLLRVCQGCNLSVHWGCIPIWSSVSPSKLILVVGRTRFLAIIGPKSLVSCWLSAAPGSQRPCLVLGISHVTVWFPPF